MATESFKNRGVDIVKNTSKVVIGLVRSVAVVITRGSLYRGSKYKDKEGKKNG